MTSLFLGSCNVVPKIDNGDIGEAIRWSQAWYMFGPDAPNRYVNIFVSARLPAQPLKGAEVGLSAQTQHVDVLRALRHSDWGERSELSSAAHTAAVHIDLVHLPHSASQQWAQAVAWNKHDIGERFEKGVRARWALRETGERPLEDRLRRLAMVWCAEGAAARRALGRSPFSSVSFFIRGVQILPPASIRLELQPEAIRRFERLTELDTNVTARCDEYAETDWQRGQGVANDMLQDRAEI